MLERMKAVNNPLTIIAIFAMLAEVAGTVALATVAESVQHVFVWFVMGFPSVLVGMFFATLNFNPSVLYAPSDFRDEANFLSVLSSKRVVRKDFIELTSQVESTKEILNQTLKEKLALTEAERLKFEGALAMQFDLLKSQIEVTRMGVEDAAIEAAMFASNSLQQTRILKYLSDSKAPRSLEEIAAACRSPLKAAEVAMRKLISRKAVTTVSTGADGSLYQLKNS